MRWTLLLVLTACEPAHPKAVATADAAPPPPSLDRLPTHPHAPANQREVLDFLGEDLQALGARCPELASFRAATNVQHVDVPGAAATAILYRFHVHQIVVHQGAADAIEEQPADDGLILDIRFTDRGLDAQIDHGAQTRCDPLVEELIERYSRYDRSS